MLTPKPQLSLKNAKEYFREHLCVGDYYAENQQVAGEWFGVGASRLGLQGKVSETEFLRMCEGLHPTSGERLTQRLNTSRMDTEGRTVANRRVFYDFTISPPKSVSIVALLCDDRILEIHDQSVKTAMVELERFAEARIRKSGARGERVTANLVSAAFRHDTSRELDPHLHTHCVVFNATFDHSENSWKALEVQGMFRAQKYAENLYYHELAKGLQSLGYQIENNARDFEIKGVSPEIITRFSKRRRQIDEETKVRIEKNGGDVNTVRRQVARDARKRKIKDITPAKLRPSWWAQLSPDERNSVSSASQASGKTPIKADLKAVLNWADEHLFERRSVIKDFELASAALSRGRGQEFDVTTLNQAIKERGYIHEIGSRKLTSRSVLRCELDVVLAARDGRQKFQPFLQNYKPGFDLSSEQKKAAGSILGSRDFITVFRGGAGTGKSFTLKEIKRGLDIAGLPVMILAPQRQQVEGLKHDDLPAETITRFLQSGALGRNGVIIVDEAGQVGAQQLRELIRVVKKYAGRIILSGDTRQHGAVAASDALCAIEKYAGIRPAELKKIRRQDPKIGSSKKERVFIREYRAAVNDAAKGKFAESFDKLDRLGTIRETSEEMRRSAVVEEFLASSARNEKAIVIGQTRAEVALLNDAVRSGLKVGGKLSASQTLPVIQILDIGEGQKKDGRYYERGQSVYFLKSYGRFQKGDLYEVAEAKNSGLVLVKNGRRSTISYRYTDRFTVAKTELREIAVGERLQMKFNGTSKEGSAINNSELVTVRRIRQDGSIVVKDDKGTQKTIGPSQRIFDRGYAMTSYASQGKTVDTVILGDCGSAAATNAKQWYVTISRGRKKVLIFTSNKEALRNRIQTNGVREQALDFESPLGLKRVLPSIDQGFFHKRWRQRAHACIRQIQGQTLIERRRKQALNKHGIKPIYD